MSQVGPQFDRPVVLRGAALSWTAVRRWSPAFLSRAVGDASADIIVSDTGVVRVTPVAEAGEGMQLNLPGVKVREAVSWILDSENGGPKTYISEQSMKDRFPSLLEDLPLPNIDDSILNMWFGSSGTVTPLHFDGYHNIFLQIFGEKTFTLFDPRHTECIYPYTNDPKLSMISQVDVTRPDFVKFPRFREPLPIKVDLRPGDILFVPIYWWHFVIAKSMSISVSQWWMPENSADEIAMLALRKYAASAGNSTAIEL